MARYYTTDPSPKKEELKVAPAKKPEKKVTKKVTKKTTYRRGAW